MVDAGQTYRQAADSEQGLHFRDAHSLVMLSDVVNTSEHSLVGSVLTRDILAVDADQQGPFSSVQYSIPPGPFSDYLAVSNPLEGNIILAKTLDYESLQSFQVQLIAEDQGSPPQVSRTSITVNILDADDQNPVFNYDRYEAWLPVQTGDAVKLIVEPEDISAFDRDLGLGSPVIYTFSGTGLEYQKFWLNSSSGEIFLTSEIPWTEFTQPATLVVKATQIDNPDRYSLTTLTVARRFSPAGGGISFLRTEYMVRVLENMPLNSLILTVRTSRPSDQRVQLSIEPLDLPGNEFSVSQTGDILIRTHLDFETAEGYSFRVVATDGGQTDTAINVNDWDPHFRFPQ